MGRNLSTRSKSIGRSALALGTALSLIGNLPFAAAEPGDVFVVAAPAVTDGPPKAADISVGDASVATQTGALNYGYSLNVPPGRNGMQPSLSLSYSSQAPTYGGVAAGWALSGIPLIDLDTSEGRIAPSVPTWTSSFSGGRQLVRVTEAGTGTAQFRAQNDSGWIRYEQVDHRTNLFYWRARTPDGTTYHFGHTDAHTTGCPNVSLNYAPLTQSIDKFGNTIDYIYQPGFQDESGVSHECRIAAITWGQNSGANVGYFAAVKFNYSTSQMCSEYPVGSQVSFRSGAKIISGASQIDTITIAAFPPQTGSTAVTTQPIPANPEHTRTITLGYSGVRDGCTDSHAKFRSLDYIEETAVGVDQPQVTKPRVTFGYGSASLNWSSTTSQTPKWLPAHYTADAYNLGWGYRFFGASAGWPTVEATMLDVDGDGRLDRLSNSPFRDTSGNVKFCQARWERNLGPDSQNAVQFGAPQYIHLPTLKWRSLTNYQGGSHAREYPSTNELCALNYQRTSYVNSDTNTYGRCMPGLMSCPNQPGQSGYCDASIGGNGSDCDAKGGQTNNTFFAWRWFDIDGDSLPDLIGSPIQGGLKSYDLQWGTGVTGSPGAAPQEPAIFGAFPACPSLPYTSNPADTANRPYTMCKGMFPWMVYKNHGNGQFGQPRPGESPTDNSTWGPLPDQIIYQPIPLETTSGDSSLTSVPVGQDQGTIDIDGDGYLDAVRAVGTSTWSVFHNDRTGRMVPFSQASPFLFNTAPGYLLLQTDGINASGHPSALEGLFDFTGDGLQDHWKVASNCPDCIALVAFNDGLQFRLIGGSPESNSMKPGTISIGQNLTINPSGVEQGVRIDSRSIFDADLDGRPDIAEFPPDMPGVLAPRIYFNQGGQFATNGDVRVDLAGVNRIVGASTRLTAGALPFYMSPGEFAYPWETRSGPIDLDADGIPELLFFGQEFASAQTMSVARVPSTTAPPRLLIDIDNNCGAVTHVDYASIHSSAVDENVAGSRMPAAQYVVKQITKTDSIASTTTATSYAYKGPQYLPDERRHFAFRGFTDVTMTMPSGAQTLEHFGYAPDWSGRLEKTVVMPKISERTVTDEVRSIDRTTWQARQLFTTDPTPITTYHAITTEHMTCANGQTEATCTAAAAAGYTKTTDTWTGLSTSRAGSSAPLLHAITSSLLQSGTVAADGDRRTDSQYFLDSDAANYRFVTLDTTELHRVAGQFTMYSHSSQKWTDVQNYSDDSYRVPYKTTTWIDAQTPATTFREYDLTTGNMTKVWKPVQWEQNENPFFNLNRTTLTYDSRKLFVASEVNELAFQTNYVWEYGTGTKLQTIGPKAGEDHRVRVDGLGRMIQRFETFEQGPGTGGGGAFLVETNTFIDGPQASITHRNAYELDSNSVDVHYREERTDLDGHGRPIKITVSVFGSAPADQITRYSYSNDGTLASVALPDPTTNDASTVTYTYTFDSLGRPKSMRRPDASLATNQSGVDITYNGLTQTTTEFVGTAGGQRASTKTRQDAFGRLVEVQEQRLASPITWAVTSYAYGPDDSMKQITDAQGAVTTLVHDMAGRRTAITRASKTWRYGYDKNDNMTSEQTPCTPVGTCEVAHTSTVVYDALDRATSKVNASRALSTADQTLFGSSSETFTYDTNPQSLGELLAWQSFPPSSGTPTSAALFTYNLQGQTENIRQTTRATLASDLERNFERNYALGGQTFETYYRDSLGSACTSGARSRNVFDARGLPSAVGISSCTFQEGGNWSRTITNTRNVASLVTMRTSNGFNTAPTESNWSYDKLGRVTSQVVNYGSPLTQAARQDLTYLGNDNPATLDHWFGATNRKRFTYTFDLRHQLTNVAEASNAFTATYGYGTAGRFSSAVETAAALPNSNVKPRSVNYVYSASDPEQLTSLKKSNNKDYAAYTYDLAGNQITRDYPDTKERWDYVYDGKNQLRRVTKKVNGAVSGSEEYWYDSDGNRNLVVKRNASGAKTEMIWFIGDVEAHYSGTGTLSRVFSHVAMGTPVFRIDRYTDGPSKGEYQFHGLTSNTIATISDSIFPAVNASLIYAPFGEVIEATDAGGTDGLANHRRRMNDKFIDEIDELAYYGARYYDRISMTWTQSDPLLRFAPDAAWARPRHASLYMMSLNNTLRYLDPDGQISGEAALEGAAIGARQGAKWGPEGAVIGAMVGAVVGAYAGHEAMKAMDVPIPALAIAESIAGALPVPEMNTGVPIAGTEQPYDPHGESFGAFVESVGDITANVPNATANGADAIGRQTLSGDGGVAARPPPVEAKTYQTYTKKNSQTGQVYSGRTSGTGSPKKNVEKRDKNHHMNKKGYGAAKLDKSSKNKKAIRGREQILIDKNGGAQSGGGTSGNAINGISSNNPRRPQYITAGKKI
jgi:RHS repeat-associated protein